MRQHLRRGLAIGALLVGGVFVSAFGVRAYTSPGASNGYVNDFANVLTEEQESVLREKIRAHAAVTTNEIAIVTIATTGDESIEAYAVKLFEEWGIGKKEKDNGILFLTAIQDRKLRIEVGYGLEPVVTDAKSAQMIAQAVPLLKAADYPGAIDQITTAILTTAETGVVPLIAADESRQMNTAEYLFLGVVVVMLLGGFGLVILASYVVLRRPRARPVFDDATRSLLNRFLKNPKSFKITSSSGSDHSNSSSDSDSSSSDSSSSSSSSSDSFGGGSSGGGGASGSW